MELTTLEQQVMIAIMRQHPNAYGVSIQNELKTRIGKEPAFGTIYACLDRLEQKGLVDSRQGEATQQRGGRRKLYFTLTAPGERALHASLEAFDAMRRGLVWRGARYVAV
jgi:DNA-binding PadR family transcriptional regulator